MAMGYLYALANESMPGVFKVGCTSRNPFDRARELHTTGVPTPFYVVAAVHVTDSKTAEASAHALLGMQGERVHEGREFFRVALEQIVRAFAQVVAEKAPGTQTWTHPFPYLAVIRRAKVYHYGHEGTPPDLKKAVKLYEEAAQLGSPEAATTLAQLYSQGQGLRKSKEKAYFYRGREPILEKQEKEAWERWRVSIMERRDWRIRESLEAKSYFSAASTASALGDSEVLALLQMHDSWENSGLAISYILTCIKDDDSGNTARQLKGQVVIDAWVQLRSCTCITTGKRSQPRKSGSVYVTDSGGARPHSGR